jgi:hypothetical protein
VEVVKKFTLSVNWEIVMHACKSEYAEINSDCFTDVVHR